MRKNYEIILLISLSVFCLPQKIFQLTKSTLRQVYIRVNLQPAIFSETLPQTFQGVYINFKNITCYCIFTRPNLEKQLNSSKLNRRKPASKDMQMFL